MFWPAQTECRLGYGQTDGKPANLDLPEKFVKMVCVHVYKVGLRKVHTLQTVG